MTASVDLARPIRTDWSPLAARRRAAYLSQSELARAIGVPRSTIWRIETGRQCPTVNMALRLSRAMGCSLFQLLEVTAEERPRATTP